MTLTVVARTAPGVEPVALGDGTVELETRAGTAAAELDFTARSAVALGIGTGDWQADGDGHVARTEVKIAILDDALHEGNESFTVTLVRGLQAPAGLALDSATVTIADDERTPRATLMLSAGTLGERGAVAAVTAALDGPSGAATTVAVNAAAVAPATAADFTLSAERTLTIAAGATASTGTVTITAVDNEADAPDKRVTVAGTGDNPLDVLGPSAAAALLIVDDDPTPVVTLLLEPPRIERGAVATVTAVLDRPSSADTTVAVTAAAVAPAAAADFTLSAERTLTIAAGATASTGTVTITAVDNDADAPDKQVTVSGTAANAWAVDGPSEQTLTIAADDGVTVTPAALEVVEGGSAGYTVVLERQPTAAVTITVARASDADTDLTATTAALTFTTTNYADPQTVTVRAAADTDQLDGTAIFTHAAASMDPSYHGISIAPVTATEDDRTLVITDLEDAEVAENTVWTSKTPMLSGATGEVTWTLSGADAGAFTIDSGTWELTLAALPNFESPGDANTDRIYELSVTATDSADPPPRGSATVTLTVTVTDVLEPPAAPAAPTVEAAGPDRLAVSWTAPDNAGRPVVTEYDLQYRVSGERDFTDGPQDVPATGTSATITGLSAGTTYQVQVRAGSDEGNGAWSAPGNGATEALPVVTIAAAAGGESVTEGADAQFTLSRTGTPGAALAVAVSVTEKGAFLDGTPPETVTFAMGATTTTLTVATAADYDLENDGSVTAEVRPGADYTAGMPATATVAVLDDEVAVDVAVTLAESVAENAALTFTLTATTAADRAPSHPFGFFVETGTVDDGATAGADFTHLAQQAAVFQPDAFEREEDGASSGIYVQVETLEYSIAITDDAAEEEDEAFTVRVDPDVEGLPAWVTVDGTEYTGDARVFTVTIKDDDEPDWQVAVEPAAIAEAGAESSVVTVSTGPAGREVTVLAELTIMLDFPDSTATQPDDYTVGAGTLTLAVGASAVSTTITAVDDGDVDPDEEIQVAALLDRVQIGKTQTITIVDDEEAGVTVAPAKLTVPEGGSAGYTVVLNTEPAAAVTITVAPASDADTDLTATTAALTFTTTNYADPQTVTVQAAVDADQLDGTATFDHAAQSTGTDYDDIPIAPVTAKEDDRTLLITRLADAAVAENTAWTSATPMLSGADGTVTWELSGADAGAFEIHSGTGELTLPAQNYEVPANLASTDPVNDLEDNEYVVTVTATDSASPPPAGSGTVTLTVTVTDVEEPPAAPAAPTVEAAGPDRLTVSWTAPDNAGRPAVTDYHLQYRVSGEPDFTDGPQDVPATDTSATITGLSAGTTYEVQVRADNHEGTGGWSESGRGATEALPVVAVEAGATTTIGIGLASFTLTRTEPSAAALSVMVSVTEGESFLDGTPPGTVTFDADKTEAELSLLLNGNPDATGDLELTVTDGTDYEVSATNSAKLQVWVFDTVLTFRLDATEKSVGEGDDTVSATVIAQTAAGATAPELDLAIRVQTGHADDTATAGADYTALDTVLTFAPADFSLTGDVYRAEQTRSVTILDDSVEEPAQDGAHEQFTLRLSKPIFPALPDRVTVPSATGSATLTIEDDDGARVTVTPDKLTVPEGGSAGYTVVLNTLPTADVTITVARASDADEHLTATPTALTFTAADYADAQTVTVQAAADTDQLDGAATFDHAAASMDPSYHGIAIASVTAREDDRTLVITGLANAEVAENTAWTSATPMLSGADGTVTWELSGADAGAFEIHSGTGELTLSALPDFESPGDDNGDRIYELSVTATDSADPPPRGSATVALTVTVTNVLELPAAPAAPTVEAAGPASLEVSWTAPDNAGRPDITLYDLQYQSGEASFTAGPQDVPATDTSATITGLSAGTTYDVVVRAVNVDGDGAWSDPVSGATDELRVTVTPDKLTVPEGGSAGYTVVLNTLPTADVTITVTPAGDADTDLTATTAALTFTTTNYADAQTVTVEAATDTDQLDGMATFDHTAASMDPSYNGIAIESVTAREDDRTLLITDLADAEVAENEVWTSPTPGLSGADGTVTWELSGADAGAFTIDSGTRKLTLPAQNYEAPTDAASTDPVNALKNNEYVVTVTATDSASPPPAGSGTVTLTVTVTDANDPPTGLPEISGTAQVGETLTAATGDIADEDGLGTFSYQWQAVGADIAGATAATYEPVAAHVGDTLTVVASFTDGGGTEESVASALTAAVLTASTEQQGSTVAFGAGSYRAYEGGTAATVTVTLSPAPTAEVEIPLTAVGLDGATDGDWSGVPGNVTFAASKTSQSFTVSATDDRVDDDGESVLLAFGTLPAGVTEGTPDTATVAIEDDDTRGVTVSETKLTVDEGGSDDYTVVLTSEPTGDVTVTVGGESVDVTADPTTLTFTAMQWDTVQTVTVSAAEDPDAQAEAAVILTHTVSGADYGAVSAGGVTVTVVETDTPTLSVAAAKASESAGTMAFEVTLSVASSDAITVDYETSDDTGDTATAGSDYTAISGTLTFPVDTTAQTISVPVTDDDEDETAEEETFTLTLSNAMGAALAGGEATLAVSGTIVDDDDPQVTVEFGAADYTVREGETVDVQVTLSADPERTVEIPLTATDQGQTSAADYSGVPASLTFDVGDTMKTFTFAAIDDPIDDDDDSVKLGFGMLPAGVIAAGTTTATVSITDDDAAPGTNTATGQPVIPTTVYMFEPVVANTDAIADADGLSDPQFRYQWWAGDTGDAAAAAAITGATLKRFTPGEDQFGRWLQVVVSFTDDLDHKETVSSERSLPVRTRATDYTQPLQVSLGSRAPDPVGAEFTVEFSFFIEYNGEPVMGFELADITVSNGTASELRLDVNRYAVTITPATLGEEVTVQVPAGAVWWAGDSNKLNQASPVLTRQTEVDEVPPVASMKLHNGRGPLSGPYELGVTFSERVRELQREDFTVMPAEATLSHVALGASGKYGVVRVTPPDAEYAGTITVTLNAGAVLDFGDNGNESAVSLRRDLEADDKPPRVWVWSSYFGEEEIGLGDRHLYLGSSDWVYGLKKYRVKLQDAADESDTIGASLRGPWYDHTTLYVKVAERESYPECLKLTVKAGAFEDWVGQPVAEQVLYLTNGWQVRNCPPPEAPEEEESAGAEGVLPVTVTRVSVAADANGDGSWTAGEAVEVTVRFSEAVTVDTGGGTPGLAVVVGAASREAGYAGGTGTGGADVRLPDDGGGRGGGHGAGGAGQPGAERGHDPQRGGGGRGAEPLGGGAPVPVDTGGVGGRRERHRGQRRDRRLRGDAGPGGDLAGDGGLRDGGRHGARGRGLHRRGGHAELRGRRHGEDGRGHHPGRRRRRGRGALRAAAEQRGRRGAGRRRGGGRHDRQQRSAAAGVAGALRAHGGRARAGGGGRAADGAGGGRLAGDDRRASG